MDPYLRIIDAARRALTLHQWPVEPDFDQEGEVQRAESVLAGQPDVLPPLLAVAHGFRVWIESGEGRAPIPHGPRSLLDRPPPSPAARAADRSRCSARDAVVGVGDLDGGLCAGLGGGGCRLPRSSCHHGASLARSAASHCSATEDIACHRSGGRASGCAYDLCHLAGAGSRHCGQERPQAARRALRRGDRGRGHAPLVL